MVKHRNSITTWSSEPVQLTSNTTCYFTTAASQAYGSNQVSVDPGTWAFYSGDLNQDENTDLIDLSIMETGINNFLFGYQSADINGDGNVELLDGPTLETNVNNFVFSAHP